MIGCEFASIFAELGVPVTIVEMLDRLIAGEDRRASAALTQAFARPASQSLVQDARRAASSSPRRDASGLALSDGATVAAALVLVCVGRSPVSAAWASKRPASTLDAGGFVVTDDTQRTTLDGVFAAGDVAGPPLLAHWAYRQGAAAAENAVLGGRLAVDRALRAQLHLQPPRGGELRHERRAGQGGEPAHRRGSGTFQR